MKYGLVNSTTSSDDEIRTLAPSSIAWGKRNTSEGNISNSTLRRKLFAGNIHDDEDDDDTHNEDDFDDDNDFTDIKTSKVLTENKENFESTAMVISPGKIMMTPNAQRIPSSPNKSVSNHLILSQLFVIKDHASICILKSNYVLWISRRLMFQKHTKKINCAHFFLWYIQAKSVEIKAM